MGTPARTQVSDPEGRRTIDGALRPHPPPHCRDRRGRRRSACSRPRSSGPAAGAGPAAGRAPNPPSFGSIVHVSKGADTQAAEPSIRVDRTGKQRIWIAAPTGIGVNSRSLPANGGGDLFWHSDDAGATWKIAGGPGGASSPTVVGGGDSDVAVGYSGQVYGTGLTLANVTLAASCDNGQQFQTNPISNLDSVEDRQWIDAYGDHPAPSGGPDFVLDYGSIALQHVVFHQVLSPQCANPVAGPAIDVNRAGCEGNAAECYQWPGNLAIDERNGDVYVTYNTQGNPAGDKVVVTRVDGGASRTATPADVHPFVAAANRPDTFDSFTVVAVDRAGNVYASWSERHKAEHRTDVMLAVSTDRGAPWSRPVQVSRSPATSTFPWLVAGSAGRVDVVYYGTTGRPAPRPRRSPTPPCGASIWPSPSTRRRPARCSGRSPRRRRSTRARSARPAPVARRARVTCSTSSRST